MEQVYELVCSGNVRTEIVVQVPKNYQAYADTLGYVDTDFTCHYSIFLLIHLRVIITLSSFFAFWGLAIRATKGAFYRGHYPRTCVKTSFWQ